VAGCGGGSEAPRVANLGTAGKPGKESAASAPLSPHQQEAVDDAYVACLNAHGAQARVMPGGGVGLIATPASQGRVATARKACQKLLPKGGLPPPSASQIDQRVAQMLKLAGCMRSNGVPKFRDATATGSLMINPSSGIGARSPQFQQAKRREPAPRTSPAAARHDDHLAGGPSTTVWLRFAEVADSSSKPGVRLTVREQPREVT